MPQWVDFPRSCLSCHPTGTANQKPLFPRLVMFDWPIENLFKQLLIVCSTVNPTALCFTAQPQIFHREVLGINSRERRSRWSPVFFLPEQFFSPSNRSPAGIIYLSFIIFDNLFIGAKSYQKAGTFPAFGRLINFYRLVSHLRRRSFACFVFIFA